MYRVNAIKSPDGVWREFPCGREALFHHYPEFDSNRGNVGDTLVWDSYQDRLIIQEEFRHYRALCYRENRSIPDPDPLTELCHCHDFRFQDVIGAKDMILDMSATMLAIAQIDNVTVMRVSVDPTVKLLVRS